MVSRTSDLTSCNVIGGVGIAVFADAAVEVPAAEVDVDGCVGAVGAVGGAVNGCSSWGLVNLALGFWTTLGFLGAGQSLDMWSAAPQLKQRLSWVVSREPSGLTCK